MRKEDARSFWVGLLLALLLARAIRALFSTLYYQSLATLRLNESALWMLVVLAPALALLIDRRGARASVLVAAVATSALPLTRFTPWHVPVAALATGASLLALARAAALPGALAGLALDGALLVLGASADPLPGLAVAGAIGALLLVLAWRAELPARPPRGWAAGAAAAALVAAEVAYLASPYALGRWTASPAWLAMGASALGLAVGATRLRHAGRWVWVVGALALVDLAWARSPLVPLSVGLGQCALGVAGARLAPALCARGGAIAFAAVLAPLSFVLLYFRSPLGLSEWGALVPLLAVLACAPAVFETRAPRAARRLGAAPVAALAVLAVVAAALPAPIAQPSEEEIRFVSWNVHFGFGNRGALDPAIYAEVLRGLEPDVVVLQESDSARLSSGGLDIVAYLARELDMRAAYGRSGAAVLSRFPFAEEPRPPEEEWSYEIALDVRGTTLWVHGVHLARSRDLDEREAQVQALLADEHGPHHVIAGDLNACPPPACFGGRPSGDTYPRLTTRYEDAWVAAGNAIDDPRGFTHPAWSPSRRIDHLLLEGVEALEVAPILDELTRAGSDHLPVFARLRIAE